MDLDDTFSFMKTLVKRIEMFSRMFHFKEKQVTSWLWAGFTQKGNGKEVYDDFLKKNIMPPGLLSHVLEKKMFVEINQFKMLLQGTSIQSDQKK